MKRVVIVHGWGGTPEDDWIPWLKSELENAGYKVLAPEMPNTDSPVISEWVAQISKTVGTPDSNTYFIGGSIGCQAILRYLQTIEIPIGGAVFVAGWFDLENLNPEEHVIAEPWIETPLNEERIERVLPRSSLIISEDDPFGAFDFNVHKFSELGSNIVVLANAGHITEEYGYLELPQAIEELEKLVEQTR